MHFENAGARNRRPPWIRVVSCLAAAGSLSVALPDAKACSPEFPTALLQSGSDLSTRLPRRTFHGDLERLGTLPPARFPRVDSGDPEDAARRVDVEALDRWLDAQGEDDPGLRAGLLRARQQMHDLARLPGADAGDGRGEVRAEVDIPEGLPAELRLYLEGAEAYRRGDFDRAAERWRALLELPADDRRERTVMAHYMLGRALPRTDEAADGPSTGRVDDAVGHFAAVRRLAGDGWRDDLGLAHESLGWEARLDLYRGRIPRALELYAEQLQADDPTAADSITIACSHLTRADGEALSAAAADATTRDIYSLYLAAYDFHGEAAARWLDAAVAEPADIAAAGTLAWVAYQHGRFPDAERWLDAAPDSDPFVPWLRSKLAARAGDFETARAQLVEASRALAREPERIMFGSRNGYWQWAAAEQARAEAGAIELERGRYAEALDKVLRAGYWIDAAYLAERVMTVEELRAYVEETWPDGAESEPTSGYFGGATPFGRDAIAVEIRYLLARRLARDGRWGEARGFFPEHLRGAAVEIRDQIARSDDRSLPKVDRADALWRVARSLRQDGLELVGTELDPDWNIWGAHYDLGDFARSDARTDEEERARRARPRPNRRFHYRYVAAELGWRAAELLPDQSEQTARVLATAGTWLKNLDPDRADRFYKALVRRCGETPLGREADRRRWFPDLDF
ncbi:MAG: hypothetical protein AAGF23_15435 [Acidobacteriota bacterium]